MPKLITMHDVLAMLAAHGVPRTDRTIERLVKRGQFPQPTYIGGSRLWPEASVQRWLSSKLEAA